MTNRPTESPNDPEADPLADPDAAPLDPETDTDGLPEPDQDQPVDVESGDVAESPTDPGEEEPGQMPESTNTEVGA